MLPSGAIDDLKFTGLPALQSPRVRAIPCGMLSQPTPAQIVSPPLYIPFANIGLRRSPTRNVLLSPSRKSANLRRLLHANAPFMGVVVMGPIIKLAVQS